MVVQHHVGWGVFGADLAYLSASYEFLRCKDMIFSLQVIFESRLIRYEVSV